MTRIFLKEKLELEKEIKITDKIHHYLINVMRHNINDNIVLVNGADGEFLSKIIFTSVNCSRIFLYLYEIRWRYNICRFYFKY